MGTTQTTPHLMDDKPKPVSPPPPTPDPLRPIIAPRPTWRSKASNWFFGLKPADSVLKRRAAGLVDKLEIAEHLQANGTYVDIGSGTGHIPTQIARRAVGLHARFVCIEPVSRPTKRVLHRMRTRTDGHVHFARSIGNRLPLPDGVANGVSAFFVLHHIPYPIQLEVLAEIKRVLVPGGLFFLWEDTPRNEREFLANEVWDRRLNFEPRSEPHFYRSGDDWQKLLTESGFEPVNQAYYEDHSRRRGEGLIRHTGFVSRHTPASHG